MTLHSYTIEYPGDLDAQAEMESMDRGVFPNIKIVFEDKCYTLSFFTPKRLDFEINAFLERESFRALGGGIVVIRERLDRNSIKNAVQGMVAKGSFQRLVGIDLK